MTAAVARRGYRRPVAEDHFAQVFGRLRAILVPYASEMEVVADSDTEYGLQTRWRRPKDGYPAHFGSVKALREADPDRIADVPGFGPAMARRVWDALNKAVAED